MKDDKSRKFMEEYMVPNSRDNEILGIQKIVVKGPFTFNDMELIKDIFKEYIIKYFPITIALDKE